MGISRRWRLLLGAALAAVLLLAALVAAAPGLIQRQLESRGSAALGRTLRVGQVELSLRQLSLTLKDVSLGAAAGSADATPQLQLARLHADVAWESLWRGAPVVQALQLDAPRLRLAHQGQGRLDIDDILARFKSDTPAPADAPPARFALNNIELRDGELRFDDQPVRTRHELRALHLGLPFLSNLPSDVQVKVLPRLAFQLNGSAVDLRGTSTPFAAGRATELKLDLGAVELARWWPYLPQGLPLRPQGGRLQAQIGLRFAQPAQGAPQLSLRGPVSLDDIRLLDAAGQPVLAWQHLGLTLADLQPLQRRLNFGPLQIDGLLLDAQRDARGRINLLALASPPPAGAKAAAAAAPAASAAAPASGDGWQVQLASATLKGATLRWRDALLRPAAAYEIAPLNLQLQALQWPVREPSALQLDATLQGGGKTVAQLQAEGTVAPSQAALKLALDGVDLAAAAPYLKGLLAPSLHGRVQARLAVDWRADEAEAWKLKLQSARVDDLALHEGSGRAADKPLQVGRIELANLEVDGKTQRVQLGQLKLTRPRLQVLRDAKGQLNLNRWWQPVAAAPAPAGGPAAKAAPPWQLRLQAFQLDEGQVQWRDEAVAGGTPVNVQVVDLKLGLQGLQWPPPKAAAPLRSELQARVVNLAGISGEIIKGRNPHLEWRGSLNLQPLQAKGTLKLRRLAVHAFSPYFQANLPVLLRRADAAYEGELDFAMEPAGPRLRLQGEAAVAALALNARAGAQGDEVGDELMSWSRLAAKPLKLQLAPGSTPVVEIGQLTVDELYSRLVITEQGRFNLLDVAARPPAGGGTASVASAAPAAAAPASAPAPAAAASAAAPPVLISVENTRLNGARIDFSDRFVRPNYSAALSELNGSLGRFSSQSRDMAALELRGRAAGTAKLEIVGALNPTAQPLALDIQARATDLELAPFSPYAAKYAGYAIERGKLSLDVAYKISPDGQLQARNQVVLNQLTLGDAVDSPDATKLPVRLALALLKDRNGVIDINLPISGSINDPQFSVFGIVLKVIGNLLLKAVTAPFSLLSGGGGADELSAVAFDEGSARPAGASQGVIDKVAQALSERPSLHMTVTGAADPVSERDAIARSALEAQLQAEQRRERSRSGGVQAADAPLPPPTGEERERLLKRLYDATPLTTKPRDPQGRPLVQTAAQMEALLRAGIVVSTDTARELAVQRALAVRDALVARGLASERLFLAAPQLRASGEDDAAWSPRVTLTLSAR